MKTLAFAIVIALAPVGTVSAFQVVTPDQMQESGMGLAEGRYFSREQTEQQVDSNTQLQLFGGARTNRYQRSSSERNFYGRVDGGGRYFGDRNSSNYQGCDYAESNAGKLDAMSGRGYAYPCQRFR